MNLNARYKLKLNYMETYHGNTLEYWKNNAEEDYLKTPISVLKYITVLEEVVSQQNNQTELPGNCNIHVVSNAVKVATLDDMADYKNYINKRKKKKYM